MRTCTTKYFPRSTVEFGAGGGAAGKLVAAINRHQLTNVHPAIFIVELSQADFSFAKPYTMSPWLLQFTLPIALVLGHFGGRL
jgi:hypothetical protein